MIKELKDESLLCEIKLAAQAEKKSTARVLEYLSEVDSRRLWVKEGYSSLHDFCVRYLNYSESEANRRIQAARLTLEVEEVRPLLEAGTMSLTTLCLLSPHLNQANAKAILPQITTQSTRRVEAVIKANFPNAKQRKEVFQAELDEELTKLVEEARLIASEKDSAKLLKVLLKNYLREKKTVIRPTKKHTRYVQKPLAREIKKEANYQCTYKGPTGIRCNQTAHLQNDHVIAWANGGSSKDKKNLRCLCKVHNLYFAQRDFPKGYPWKQPDLFRQKTL